MQMSTSKNYDCEKYRNNKTRYTFRLTEAEKMMLDDICKSENRNKLQILQDALCIYAGLKSLEDIKSIKRGITEGRNIIAKYELLCQQQQEK